MPNNSNQLNFDINKPFALVRRKEEPDVLVLTGQAQALEKLDDIPRPGGINERGEVFDTISAIPFAQIKERGFRARDDGAKILCLQIEKEERVPLEVVLASLPDESVELDGGITYDHSESEYGIIIKNVIEKEIGNGEGANFVIPRVGSAQIKNMSSVKALAMYKNLLRHEKGSYWNFIFYDGERYLLGATPERHISLRSGHVKMNPISGTMRKSKILPDAGSFKTDLTAFLKNEKEINELFMVVDEELKMMAKLCARGGMIIGPLLKEMANLIHTEYMLAGQSDMDAITLLRDSMYAATVTGSPVENACNIIYKYEAKARRYYGSAIALLGRDASGRETLDSPILIRCFEINKNGQVLMRVGSTLVRDSEPADEVEETKVKISGLLHLIQKSEAVSNRFLLASLENDEDIQELLQLRNQALSKFWFFNQENENTLVPELAGKTITIIDNEDDFVYMTKHILARMGLIVNLARYADYSETADRSDLVIVGPGPGNPNDADSAKMQKLNSLMADLLVKQRKFLGICLGHQVLCRALGLAVVKKDEPFQGVPAVVDYFGRPERVGFYNTFTGKYGSPVAGVEFAYDKYNGDINALRAARFAGFQFHPESILTQHGYDILKEILIRLLCSQAS